MTQNPFILPTVILLTILLAWGLIHRYAKPAGTGRPAPADDRTTAPTRVAA